MWRWRNGHYPSIVQCRTEAEVLAALAQPRPFYAELTQ